MNTYLVWSSGTVCTLFWQYWTISENSNPKVLTLICKKRQMWYHLHRGLIEKITNVILNNWLLRSFLYWAVFRGYLMIDFFSRTPSCFWPGYWAWRPGSSRNKMAAGVAARRTVVDRYFTRIFRTGSIWIRLSNLFYFSVCFFCASHSMNFMTVFWNCNILLFF